MNPSVSIVSTKSSKGRRGFISPTSSFVDFAELESEYYTAGGLASAELYNPHNTRRNKKPTTDFETAVHLLKGSVGAGMLAMPMAFLHAGVLIGVIGTFCLGTLCVYAITIMLKMQYIQCKRLQVPFLTLPRSMRIAFLNGPRYLRPLAVVAPAFVDFFLVAYQLGICTAYVIFIADSIKSIAEPRIVEHVDKRVYVLLIFIPVLLINFIRNLKKLTPISLVSNVLIIISLIIVFYIVFFVDAWKIDETNLVSTVQTWPLFMGTVLFSLEAIGVIIALEHNMEFPEHFLGKTGIFPWSLAVVVTLYMAVGLLGYLKYGKDTKETIIACLPQDNWLTLAVEGVYALCIYGTYPLQCYVSLEIIWGNYLGHHIDDPQKECIVEYMLRIIVVIITFLLALVIPHIDIIISLVGALCLSCLGIIFPFCLELCTLWPDQLGRYYHILIKDILFIALGFFILVIGTYVSIYSLFQK